MLYLFLVCVVSCFVFISILSEFNLYVSHKHERNTFFFNIIVSEWEGIRPQFSLSLGFLVPFCTWADDRTMIKEKKIVNRKKKIISVLTLFGREYNWSNSNTAPTSFKSHYFSFICTFVHINLAKFVWRLYNNKLLNGGWFLYFFFFFSFDKSLCAHITALRAFTVCGWQSVERYAFMWVDESSFFILFHDELLHIFVFSFFSHACSLVFIIAFGCLPTHYKKGVFKP